MEAIYSPEQSYCLLNTKRYNRKDRILYLHSSKTSLYYLMVTIRTRDDVKFRAKNGEEWRRMEKKVSKVHGPRGRCSAPNCVSLEYAVRVGCNSPSYDTVQSGRSVAAIW
jgi:hypothetical protein